MGDYGAAGPETFDIHHYRQAIARPAQHFEKGGGGRDEVWGGCSSALSLLPLASLLLAVRATRRRRTLP